jgi:hypothetical protein
MRYVVMLCLLAVPLQADAPGESHVHPDVEQVIKFAGLSPEQAAALDGCRGVFVVTLDTDNAPDDEDAAGPVLRNCLPCTADVCRSVVLPPGNHAGSVLVIEGVLRMSRHTGFIGAGGVEVPPLVQLRVLADKVR